jgi:membrane protease YdiL (CAAX protease family)
LYDLLLISIFFIALIMMGLFSVNTFYDTNTIKKMTDHELVIFFTHHKGNFLFLLIFLLTMVMEELIFRFYLMGFFVLTLNVENLSGILFTSLIFSFYHFHTWFAFKDKKILFSYLLYSFFLGWLCSLILLKMGIIFSIIAHSSLAALIYKYTSKIILRMDHSKSEVN